ncbi:adhesion G-protein coupled receptor F3 [Spea bombifrons]|uniref:adhesion G-protein coupled receptor F3 n=1 Tax=Spea bombifrons TaxID=233779 RepID=UPI00234A5973|nr:adhesion G-protein coupled receptor F3 [Spea bombifrons]
MTKCRATPSCSVPMGIDSYCMCAQGSAWSMVYCEEPPPNPGSISLLSSHVGVGGDVHLLFSSSEEVTNIQWFLVNVIQKQTRELHNGTKTTIVTTGAGSVLSIREISRSWEGVYVCRYRYQNLLWQSIFTFHLPLQPGEIRTNPASLTLWRDDPDFGGVTLECCILDDGEFYNVVWEPHSTPADIEVRHGEVCFSLSLDVAPESDTRYRCVFQDSANRSVAVGVPVAVIQVTDVFCPVEYGYNAVWNVTKVGQVQEIPCPRGKRGRVTRRCLKDGEWEAPQAQCVDAALLALLGQIQRLRAGLGIPEEEIPGKIQTLRNYTLRLEKSVHSFWEVVTLVEAIRGISLAATENHVKINSSTMADFATACSQVLDLESQSAWADAFIRFPSLGAVFMQSVENMTKSLEPNGRSLNLILPNVQMKVLALSNLSASDYNLTFYANPAVEVYIKNATLQRLLDLGNLTAASVVLRKLAPFLPGHYGEGLEDSSYVTKSNILINAIVTQNGSMRQADVDLVFAQDYGVNDTRTGFGRCVFWDYTSFGGVGGWSTEGCLSFPEDNDTLCRCDRLASFSILMSASEAPEDFSLKFISYFGVVTSVVCLVICLVIYAVEWKSMVTNEISFYHQMAMANVASSLLIADVWFLASSFMEKNHTNSLCISAAFFQHLFHLAIFFWTLFQGLVLLHQLVFVFQQPSRLAASAIMAATGYLCPLVIAVVTLAIYYPMKSYIEDGACFLNGDNGAIHAFSIPVLCVVVVNIFIATLAVWKLLRSAVPEGPDGEDKEALMSIFKALIVLTIDFGLTWLLGIITMVMDVDVVFHYLFHVTSFQGLFILLLGCLTDKKIRDVLSEGCLKLRARCPALPSLNVCGRDSYSMDQGSEEQSLEIYKPTESGVSGDG